MELHPTASSTSLRKSLERLPRELYDKILHHVIAYDSSSADPSTGLTTRRITPDYKPPIQFHLSHSIRESYATQYYKNSIFILCDINRHLYEQYKSEDPLLEASWLASLSDAHFELLLPNIRFSGVTGHQGSEEDSQVIARFMRAYGPFCGDDQ